MSSSEHRAEYRYASTDEDVIAIHRFLCLVGQPQLCAPIDALKSVTEINRVVHDRRYGFAIIAEINGEIVGSLGIIGVDWWYAKARFFTDRWLFVYPALANKGIGMAMIAEAGAIATAADMDLLINGKAVRRNRNAGRGLLFVSHHLIKPGERPEAPKN